MNNSFRTYFMTRQAWKEFLRRERRLAALAGKPESFSEYFTSHQARAQYRQRIAEAQRREITYYGIPLVIEIAAGEEDPHRMEDRKSPAPSNYGSIQNTLDKDLEPIDFFLAIDASEFDLQPTIWVVDQIRRDGSFDEHKVLLGFKISNEKEAERTYLDQYDPGWYGFGAARSFTLEQFRDWLQNYDPTQPVTGKVKNERSFVRHCLDSDGNYCRHGSGDVGAVAAAQNRPKALAESSGPAGGYAAVDWYNIRCPSCGGRMSCDCGRKESNGDQVRNLQFYGGSASGRTSDTHMGDGGLLVDRKEGAPVGASFPESTEGAPPSSDWRTDSLNPSEVFPGPETSGAGLAGSGASTTAAED